MYLHRGVCTGGPLDGQTWESRFPDGFLLVDRPTQRVLIYDTCEDGFLARSEVYVEERARRISATLGDRFDVWTYDSERMGAW